VPREVEAHYTPQRSGGAPAAVRHRALPAHPVVRCSSRERPDHPGTRVGAIRGCRRRRGRAGVGGGGSRPRGALRGQRGIRDARNTAGTSAACPLPPARRRPSQATRRGRREQPAHARSVPRRGADFATAGRIPAPRATPPRTARDGPKASITRRPWSRGADGDPHRGVVLAAGSCVSSRAPARAAAARCSDREDQDVERHAELGPERNEITIARRSDPRGPRENAPRAGGTPGTRRWFAGGDGSRSQDCEDQARCRIRRVVGRLHPPSTSHRRIPRRATTRAQEIGHPN